MSRADANSQEGESGRPAPPSDFYRNYDHVPGRPPPPRRANPSQIPGLPAGEGPAVPSPPPQRRLVELGPPDDDVYRAPLAQDETQLLPAYAREYITAAVSLDFLNKFSYW